MASDALVDRVLLGGRILTQEPGSPTAEAMALAGDRIAAVGTVGAIRSLAGPRALEQDLAGSVVVPGFNDAHVHVWKLGSLLTSVVDLRGTTSQTDLRARLTGSTAARTPGSWVVARGLNEADTVENRLPDRDLLDRTLPGHPVFVTRTCGHIGIASSRALEEAGIGATTPDPPGGIIRRDAAGRPTGVLEETALGLVTKVLPAAGPPDHERMILAASEQLLTRGITAVSEAGVTAEILEVYRDLEARGALPLRFNVMVYRAPDGRELETLSAPRAGERLRVDTIKLLADGGLSGATAAVREPYQESGDRGVLRLDAPEIVALARDAHASGLRIAVHAIGERAIDAALDAFEELARSQPGPRHRIEHFGLPEPAQIRRAAALGVIVVPQAVFLKDLGRNFRRFLAGATLRRAYPLRSMLDAGLLVALSSDAPVVRDASPLLGIETAVTRADTGGEPIAPGEAITPAEALRAYTRAGAEASGDGHRMGTLAPGRWADFAVLDADPTTVDPTAIGRITVRETWIAGRRVWPPDPNQFS